MIGAERGTDVIVHVAMGTHTDNTAIQFLGCKVTSPPTCAERTHALSAHMR